MSKEKYSDRKLFQTLLIVFFFVFCIVVILFNAGENLIQTAYEFEKSITRGNSEFAWQLLTPSAKKAVDKSSLTSTRSAIEMFEKSEMKPPAVDGIGFFNAKLTISDGVIYFHRGIGGWKVEYVGPAVLQQVSVP
ncbi:MAG: hypothetical protein KGZ96_04760 [Clostridia bacterium]|nr:hypothetical protein [Clostridia bacterium]